MHAWGKGHTGTLSPDGGGGSFNEMFLCVHPRSCMCVYVRSCVCPCMRETREGDGKTPGGRGRGKGRGSRLQCQNESQENIIGSNGKSKPMWQGKGERTDWGNSFPLGIICFFLTKKDIYLKILTIYIQQTKCKMGAAKGLRREERQGEVGESGTTSPLSD